MAADDIDLSVIPVPAAFVLRVPKDTTGARTQGVTIYDMTGADGAHTFTALNLSSTLGPTTESPAATPSATSSISGILRLIATTLSTINTTGGVTDADTVAGFTLNTKTILNGATSLVPKFAKIDRATNADGAAVVNLVSAKKIRVLRYHFVCAAGVGVKWQSSTSNSSGAGSNTDLTPVETYAANGGIAEPFCPLGIVETVAGEALKLNLNGAQQVSGNLTYIEV